MLSLALRLALHSIGTVFPQPTPVRCGSSGLSPLSGPGVWTVHRTPGGGDPSGNVGFLSDSVIHTWGRGTCSAGAFHRTRKPSPKAQTCYSNRTPLGRWGPFWRHPCHMAKLCQGRKSLGATDLGKHTHSLRDKSF